jgi:CheY-like chemotaxis protein
LLGQNCKFLFTLPAKGCHTYLRAFRSPYHYSFTIVTHSSLAFIVDDNQVDLFVISKVLESKGFCKEIRTFLRAAEALEALQEGTLPQFVFLDLNMPEMDGFQFLFEFAQLPEEVRSGIQIIVLTSSESSRDKEKALANDLVSLYFSKPISYEKVEEIQRDLQM